MATVITSKGKEIEASRLIGASPAQGEPKFLSVGVTAPNSFAGTSAAPDVALFNESAETRVTGTSSSQTTTTTNDTYQVTGTVTATGARAVVETGLFDSATKPTANTVAAGGVVGSAVATTLNTGSTFTPGNNNYVQIRGEVMQVTAGSGSTALTVVRAQNGSSASSALAAGDIVTPGNPPGQTGVTGGTLYVHGDFLVINLSSGDSVTLTIKVQYS